MRSTLHWQASGFRTLLQHVDHSRMMRGARLHSWQSHMKGSLRPVFLWSCALERYPAMDLASRESCYTMITTRTTDNPYLGSPSLQTSMLCTAIVLQAKLWGIKSQNSSQLEPFRAPHSWLQAFSAAQTRVDGTVEILARMTRNSSPFKHELDSVSRCMSELHSAS